MISVVVFLLPRLQWLRGDAGFEDAAQQREGIVTFWMPMAYGPT